TARRIETARTTTSVGIAALKALPTTRRSAPAREEEAQLSGHAAAVPRRPYAPGRRRNWPHATRQQQRLLPGQRDLLGELGAQRRTGVTVGVCPSVGSAIPRAARVSSPQVLSRTCHSGRGGPGDFLVRALWQGDVGRDLAEGRCPLAGS